jgi:hypothetical protein
MKETFALDLPLTRPTIIGWTPCPDQLASAIPSRDSGRAIARGETDLWLNCHLAGEEARQPLGVRPSQRLSP